MSGYETALAGTLTTLGVGATILGRYWPAPTGRHRRPTRPPFALAVQEFRMCATCGVETAAVVHPGGAFHCAEGHLTVPGGGDG